MRGYLNVNWPLAVSANPYVVDDNDKGQVWVHKTVMLLWSFTHDMWEH
jgi:hypothetical protein